MDYQDHLVARLQKKNREDASTTNIASSKTEAIYILPCSQEMLASTLDKTNKTF